LAVIQDNGINVDRCPECRGAWYEDEELGMLESNVADDDSRRGKIDYAKRESELKCPVCSKVMQAFNYRANNLELDACTDAHGFWLDGGEDERVMHLMRERIAGLQRAGSAQDAWNDIRRGVKSGGFMDKFKGMFGGGPRKGA
jgi:Zn-finger nucleic acid-binding protein